MLFNCGKKFTDYTVGTSQMLYRRLSQTHENTRKLQHIMDCSHKCDYLLCSPALFFLRGLFIVFILSGSPAPPACLINISLELLRTKVYHLKNPYVKTLHVSQGRIRKRWAIQWKSSQFLSSNQIESEQKKRKRKAANIFSLMIVWKISRQSSSLNDRMCSQ